MGKITYRQAGVDIKNAERFIKSIKGLNKKNNVTELSAFGSLYYLGRQIKNVKKPVLVSSTDGVGTKLKIAQELNIHDTVGIDLVAMNVNDIVCLGAKPLFFLDYIACGKLNVKVLKDVVTGISNGLKESGCRLLGGETAEMPGMYKPNEYDLAGFCVGVADKKKLIDTSRIKAGDKVIGLESSGLHSNGFSLVRKVLSKRYIKNNARMVLSPTRIYVKEILSLLSSKSLKTGVIKGIAHNTGGAFYTKITKILAKGLGFNIIKNSWPKQPLFEVIQKKAKINDKEMYSTFNMGIGMIIVVSNRYVNKVKAILNRKKVKSWVIGEVIESKQKIRLT